MRPPPLLQLFRGFLPSLRVLSARVPPFIADSFSSFPLSSVSSYPPFADVLSDVYQRARQLPSVLSSF